MRLLSLSVPSPALFSLLVLGLLSYASPALAAWGETWGAMVWGLPVAVPTLTGVGLIVLALAFSASAAWTLRKRRGALGLPVLLVLLAVPLVVAAGTVTVPNTFVNGTPADANQVNANFDAVEAAVNDNDSRILTVETDTATALSTADTALTDAAAAQAEADAAVVDAATALSTANAASTDASAAQVTADTALVDASAALITADTALVDASAALITADTAQVTADTALVDADAALITADTALADASAAQSTADAAAAGHTVNTNTQLTNTQVAAAATAQGFVTGAHTTDSNTQLDEAAVDGFVANNGFGLAADVSANTAAIAALGGAVTGLQACADGLTVADHDTGLLWEKKTGTPVAFPGVVCETAFCSDPHDVANAYEWSNTGSQPDGNAFTDFLAKLNDSSQPATWSSGLSGSVGTQTTGCFADHCDWRLPNSVEIQTIFDCSFGVPCIDPLFGPTASFYWSASSNANNFFAVAWAANFNLGNVFNDLKPSDYFVRAVRAGSCSP